MYSSPVVETVLQLAITKNFVGSPHIDRFDESYQYAISFGDFTGGELCVETEQACGREVAVVNTKNKLVKVVGAFVPCINCLIKVFTRTEGSFIGCVGSLGNATRSYTSARTKSVALHRIALSMTPTLENPAE